MKDIAIVGGGIAGLACAYYLKGNCRVTLYEAAPRLGGHVHAVTVAGVPVETGFLALHRSKYPELVALLDAFGVETAPTGVGLSIWDEDAGWCFDNQAWFTLFGDRLPAAGRAHLADLVARVIRGRLPNVRLDAFLAERGYEAGVARYVLLPSIAALWGFQPAEVLAMSVRTVADMLDRFFTTAHQEPFERVVPSTDAWLSRLVGALDAQVLTGHAVAQVAGTTVDGRAYDAVVLATHADRALALLADPTAAEQATLASFPYHRSTSVVHTDAAVLGEVRREYNYRVRGENSFVTWDVARIQGVATDALVTVGPRGFTGLIDPRLEVARIDYDHPASPPEAVAARDGLAALNGAVGRYFCGSYFGSTGSNECAVASAKRVAEAILGD
ncbi:MAG: amine oxidase, flavin-containing protein [Cyanobacteria bacterium RYN_339]|nr:amine oxidase, flavin-containing protein [Cyanobacteria bacterium RYN_339]